MSEEIDLPDAVAGAQLEANLEQLLARLLSSRQLKGRTILSALEATELGPVPLDQLALPDTQRRAGADRLHTAIRQVRATIGPEAMLRILDTDSASRLPEQRTILTD